ncbi:MAG: hypothetical protein JOZ57_03300 [Abitibacteriaceae bacterium]|nr:hypothetical protein [Abditibacteriaceae bacterium]
MMQKAQILIGQVSHFSQDFDVKDRTTFVVTGKSDLKIKSISHVYAEGENDLYTVVILLTGKFQLEKAIIPLLKIGSKIFAPYSWSGDDYVMAIHHVDRRSAELLCGRRFAMAPKGRLSVKLVPQQPSYALNEPVKVTIFIKNIGTLPLSVQPNTFLSATSALNGVIVQNSVEWSFNNNSYGPHLFKPDSTLQRFENLNQKLKLDKPGRYLISATYGLLILNPQAGGWPSGWYMKYQDQFTVQIRE